MSKESEPRPERNLSADLEILFLRQIISTHL